MIAVSEDSVRFLSGLLARERVRRGNRKDSRSLSTDQEAVLVLRWLFDDTRMAQLARDNDIGLSTAYDYRDEAIAVLAARKPSLHGGAAGRQGRRPHHVLDGTLIYTDCTSSPGPTRGVDLWWSGKHRGNIPAWVDDGQLGLADLGYEGEVDTLRIPIKKTAGSDLSCDQQAYNAVHGALRALGERANSLLKITFKARRCPAAPRCSPRPSRHRLVGAARAAGSRGDHTALVARCA